MATAKEVIYDAQISPLMAQIIRICKEHKIAILCDFALGFDEGTDSELKCTTSLLSDDHEPTAEQLQALDLLYPKKPAFVAMAITITKEGS